MEKLHKPQRTVDLLQRRHGDVPKILVTIRHQIAQLGLAHRAIDIGRHDANG